MPFGLIKVTQMRPNLERLDFNKVQITKEFSLQNVLLRFTLLLVIVDTGPNLCFNITQ